MKAKTEPVAKSIKDTAHEVDEKYNLRYCSHLLSFNSSAKANAIGRMASEKASVVGQKAKEKGKELDEKYHISATSMIIQMDVM